MKYMWPNKNVSGCVKMQVGNEDFINTEYNLNMMENHQRTSPKKVKRFRSAFTTDQVNYLETQFKKFPYIGNAQRKEVAIALNIPERAVKIWFQNRRMKEKKDIVGKEFDDEPSNRKSQEFVKDQLNNVGMPSANEQQPYSLTLLSDVNKTNGGNIIMTNNTPCLKPGLLIKDSGYKTFEAGPKANSITTSPYFVKSQHSIKQNKNTNGLRSPIDLYKKYKFSSNSKPNIAKPVIKERDIKKSIELKPRNYKHIEQMIPEDLSNRKVNVATTGQIVPNMIPNNPGYFSVVPTVSPFYAQPYYPSSGVIWKPVNVVPTAPSAPIPPTVQENDSKKCCNCDCHVKPLVPYNIQQQSPNTQFILTPLQFPNPSSSAPNY